MGNFRSGFLQRGYPLGMLEVEVNLSENDQFFDPSEVMLIKLTSDSTTPSARSFSFQRGLINNQILTIIFTGGDNTTCLLSTAAQPYIRLTTAWTPQENDLIQFIWTNNVWLELYRVNTGGGENGDWAVVDLPSYDPAKWQSFANIRKIEAGRIAVANGYFESLVDANTEVLGLWPAGFNPPEITPGAAFSFAAVLRHPDTTTEFADLGGTAVSYGIGPTANTGDRLYMNISYLL